MSLDHLAPVREAFIRVLDKAPDLQTVDAELPAMIRERATVGLVAVGLGDIPTTIESAKTLDELLATHAAALASEAGQRCHADSTLIQELLSRDPA